MIIYCGCRSMPDSPRITAFKPTTGEQFEIPTPNVAFHMRCIKTGAPTSVGDRPFYKNCDVYQCSYCGAIVSYLQGD